MKTKALIARLGGISLIVLGVLLLVGMFGSSRHGAHMDFILVILVVLHLGSTIQTITQFIIVASILLSILIALLGTAVTLSAQHYSRANRVLAVTVGIVVTGFILHEISGFRGTEPIVQFNVSMMLLAKVALWIALAVSFILIGLRLLEFGKRDSTLWKMTGYTVLTFAIANIFISSFIIFGSFGGFGIMSLIGGVLAYYVLPLLLAPTLSLWGIALIKDAGKVGGTVQTDAAPG